MPDWLFEGVPAAFLAILFLVTFAGWFQTRKRGWLFAMGGVFLAGLLLMLLDKLVETGTEQIQRKMSSIHDDLNKPDMDRVFEHASEKFTFRGYDKETTRRKSKEAVSIFRVRNVRIWDVEIKELDAKNKTAKVNFLVKADSSLSGGMEYLLCRSVWVLEDGQWRIKTFDLYNPYSDSDTPLSFPF